MRSFLLLANSVLDPTLLLILMLLLLLMLLILMLLLIPSKELLLQQLSSQKANLIMVSLKVTLIKLNLTLV